MRHVKHFDQMLADAVNLNQTRIDLLEQRVQTLEQFLRGSSYGGRIRRFTPQGSWAHKTIIRPPGGKDFDADLMMVVKPRDDRSPSDYVDNLRAVFLGSGRYRDLVSGTNKTRCVRVDYAGDFHVDVVPILEEHGHNGVRFFNCNRRDDVFEETAPESYTAWWAHYNMITGENRLRKVARLVKYLRDIKGRFSCKSILLTTLLGYHVRADNEPFTDVPTALLTVFRRLDDTLQAHPEMPRVVNPVLPNEDFNRHWDQAKYENFRKKIHQYCEWMEDAYAEPDTDESIVKWMRVFGDEFAKGVEISANSKSLQAHYSFASSWLSRIKSAGRAVLQQFPLTFDHLVKPKWPVDKRVLDVIVSADLASRKGGLIEGSMGSGEIVGPNRWIRFTARGRAPFPSAFKVWWRVVNTGGDAAKHGQMRGDFYKSEPRNVRWEHTRYPGVHWVEAFVVNDRNGKIVAQSERFFVVIE